ncbi:collagen alpha-1(I) chain-like [Pezoporus wallicus]|uniref:collagen alpha-1(I) chain-like n=1 Tax=Pezoporus wallicus TaxID=35540 RepID=UPI002550AA5F|nr:collagen alpha-1(I) chain-like [Pezoporus wallicus]
MSEVLNDRESQGGGSPGDELCTPRALSSTNSPHRCGGGERRHLGIAPPGMGSAGAGTGRGSQGPAWPCKRRDGAGGHSAAGAQRTAGSPWHCPCPQPSQSPGPQLVPGVKLQPEAHTCRCHQPRAPAACTCHGLRSASHRPQPRRDTGVPWHRAPAGARLEPAVAVLGCGLGAHAPPWQLCGAGGAARAPQAMQAVPQPHPGSVIPEHPSSRMQPGTAVPRCWGQPPQLVPYTPEPPRVLLGVHILSPALAMLIPGERQEKGQTTTQQEPSLPVRPPRSTHSTQAHREGSLLGGDPSSAPPAQHPLPQPYRQQWIMDVPVLEGSLWAPWGAAHSGVQGVSGGLSAAPHGVHASVGHPQPCPGQERCCPQPGLTFSSARSPGLLSRLPPSHCASPEAPTGVRAAASSPGTGRTRTGLALPRQGPCSSRRPGAGCGKGQRGRSRYRQHKNVPWPQRKRVWPAASCSGAGHSHGAATTACPAPTPAPRAGHGHRSKLLPLGKPKSNQIPPNHPGAKQTPGHSPEHHSPAPSTAATRGGGGGGGLAKKREQQGVQLLDLRSRRWPLASWGRVKLQGGETARKFLPGRVTVSLPGEVEAEPELRSHGPGEAEEGAPEPARSLVARWSHGRAKGMGHPTKQHPKPQDPQPRGDTSPAQGVPGPISHLTQHLSTHELHRAPGTAGAPPGQASSTQSRH